MRSRATTLSAARVRRRVGAVARAARRGEAPPVVGVVDDVSPNELAGWLRLPQRSDPVLVELHLGGLVVTWTYTSPQHPGDQRARPRDRRRAARAWQDNRFHAPGRARRTAAGEIHTFSFRLQELWPYARRNTRISVRVDGQPLPIAGHGMYLSPPVDGAHAPKDLRRLLESGYVLNQRGKLALSKSKDVAWQRGVTRLHERVRAVLSDEHGLDVFLMYGSLLGAVREGGPIGHDDDLDVAYLSGHGEASAVAEEMERVALTLIHHGFDVAALPTHLHITFPDDDMSRRIDLFNCYFDDAGALSFPFGVAGTSPYTRDEWQGLERMTFLGDQAFVPASPERFLDHVYGDDWQRPRPGFRWSRSRTRAAQDARLGEERRTRVHWANFYSRHGFEQGSTFSSFVLERTDLPQDVLEIGCGDGRDACALGSAGRRVLALDASAEGVDRARAHAERLGLGQAVTFAVCDAGDRSALRDHIEELRRRVDGPITCYMRFFLHAIPDDVQDGLLQTLHECAHPGDALAVEFRTVADERTKKAHGEHFRRYVDAERLRDELQERHGFTVDHFEEGRGLSPYGDEDPVLCRIVAHRAAG